MGLGYLRGVDYELESVAGCEGDQTFDAGGVPQGSGQGVRMLRYMLDLGQTVKVMRYGQDAKVHSGPSQPDFWR